MKAEMPMMTARFATPLGDFEMLRNGRNVEYAIACGTADTYYRDGTPLHPDGCYVARVSTLGMRPGDTVVACFPSVSTLILDGGDENTVNAVAQLPAYALGIGCDDTENLEMLWSRRKQQHDREMGPFLTPRMFPYSWLGLTARCDGFVFRIEDDPEAYLQYRGVDGTPYPERTDIAVTLVWDSLAHDYAQEIVSFLTC